MTTLPVRLDRLQAGLVSVVSTILPSATVVWSPSEYPADDVPLLVALRLISGPDFAPLGTRATPMRTLPTAGTFTVGAVSDGDTLVARASGLQWEYVVGVGETTEQGRDGLLAAIDDTLIDATFSASGTTDIDVTATSLGDLWCVSADAPVTWTPTAETVCQALIGDVTAQLEIQVFSQSRYLREGAQAAATSLLTNARLPAARAIMDRHGVSIQGEPSTVTLDSLSGPGWQSRVAITARVCMTALSAETPELIENVSIDLTTKAPATQTEIDI
jgi:hypothetical protein